MPISAREAGPLLERWYRAGVAAVDPERAVARYLKCNGQALLIDGKRREVPGRLVVIAVGKAAEAMARAVNAIAGELIDAGIVLTKDGHAGDVALGPFDVFEASHPIPDARGVAATRTILDLVAGLDEGDVVLALISGGGSALLEAPRPPVTLEDLAVTTDLLLRAGAPIEALNSVRRPLSLVKAGGLLRAAAPATVHTLLLSDVLGNDPRVIASGPTVPGQRDASAALAMLDRYGVREHVPASVLSALTAVGERSDAGNVVPGDVVVIGDNNAAVEAAATAAREDGFAVDITWREANGEASELGRAWVEQCRQGGSDVEVLCGGGEATVTVRGGGVGGRNTEFALAAALALSRQGVRDWVVASLATDGDDGPTAVAGAIADPETVARAEAAGVNAAAALVDNDSLRVFEAARGIVKPGPTGTNVNDIYLAVRVAPA